MQTLHENKRGRGRPKSTTLACATEVFGSKELRSRSAIYGRMRSAQLGLVAVRLGLADSDFRDATTGRRILTKLAEVGRIFDEGFWDTAEGEDWLRGSWSNLVEMTTQDLIEWVRKNNPRAKTVPA